MLQKFKNIALTIQVLWRIITEIAFIKKSCKIQNKRYNKQRPLYIIAFEKPQIVLFDNFVSVSSMSSSRPRLHSHYIPEGTEFQVELFYVLVQVLIHSCIKFHQNCPNFFGLIAQINRQCFAFIYF